MSKISKWDFVNEGTLCKSLGGIDIPLLTISSRVNTDPENYHLIKLDEF